MIFSLECGSRVGAGLPLLSGGGLVKEENAVASYRTPKSKERGSKLPHSKQEPLKESE